jgi:pimeloyl-ACP methyl ester carboxylesterase
VRRLALVVAALALAGCGGKHEAAVKGPPLPSIAKRCGASHAGWKTLWLKASDGTLLDGAVAGTGDRGLVLLHESPNDLCGWEPYGAVLSRRGFRVLIVDLRAFGLSHRGPYGGPRGATADVRGAVDTLRSLGAKKVALVGASYGGSTALVAAPALGSDIAGVASLSGELNLPRSGLNALAAAPKLDVPLLIMGSGGDPYLDTKDAHMLAAAAKPAQPRLVMFDGTQHGWELLASTHKQRAYAVLIGFLRRVTA